MFYSFICKYLHIRRLCANIYCLGRAFAATTTEGLLVYSLDHNVIFDPFELTVDVTPDAVKAALADRRYVEALLLAFRLNEQPITCLVVERIPPSEGTCIFVLDCDDGV
jgi:periodic tryptophan protein 2